MLVKYVEFVLLLIFLGCTDRASNVAECTYIPKVTEENVTSELSSQGECGIFLDEDTLMLYPEHFNNLDFGESNLTTVYTKDRVFYVSKSGKVVRSFFFDNGADSFKEGLSRIIIKKKIGFVNEKLETVIEPQFDFAYSFENAKSMVCNGCREEKEPNGEHTMIVGGKWGVIDKHGKIILPLEYSKNEVKKKLSK